MPGPGDRTAEPGSRATAFPWGFIIPFGIAQLVSWGTFYYAFTLFLAPMGGELGWGRTGLASVFSIGIAVAGACSPFVGRWIDRAGGRGVMTLGSVAGALLLLAWSRVETYPAFVAIWIGLGAVMSAVLYDPAFAVATATLGGQARRGITVITLIAGFASTVFIPLVHYLIDGLGWRAALQVLALLSLGFCAAVHLLLVPRTGRRHADGQSQASVPKPVGRHFLGRPVFWVLTAAFVANHLVTTALAVHLLPLLQERGYAAGAAVGAVALLGPAQVGARFLIAFTERHIAIAGIGIGATMLLVLALVLLALAGGGSGLIYAVTILFGFGNGTLTIVRAVSIADFLGRERFGAIQGAMALPIMAGDAAAPFLAAALWSYAGGYGPVAWSLAAVSALSALAYASAVMLARRHAAREWASR